MYMYNVYIHIHKGSLETLILAATINRLTSEQAGAPISALLRCFHKGSSINYVMCFGGLGRPLCVRPN